MGILRFALKSSIAGGAVYYTVQEGFWSSPEETMKAYCKIYNSVAPLIQKNISQDIAKELGELPSVSTLTNCAKGMWNKGVMTSIEYISDLPTHVTNGIDYATSMATANNSASGTEASLPQSGKTQ